MCILLYRYHCHVINYQTVHLNSPQVNGELLSVANQQLSKSVEEKQSLEEQLKNAQDERYSHTTCNS